MNHEITQLIDKSSLLNKRLMTKVLESFGLTFAQYQVIKTVHAHEGLTAKDMLIYLDSDKATLSGVLSRLEARELIKRRPDDMDKRLVHIHLVDHSREICEAVEKIEKQLDKDILKGMKGREIRIVKEFMNQLMSNLLKKIEEMNKNA